MTIGEKIRLLRKDRGMTQKQLAERAGVAEISIRNYENNKRQPRMEQLSRIAHVLQINFESFLQVDTPSPLLAVTGVLEALGYKFVVYEEEGWRAMVLRGTVSGDDYPISNDELSELVTTISSYAKFQEHELIC